MSDKSKQEKKETIAPTEAELPSEVDAFFKGKNKYKHPYGDWKPVLKVDSLKRKTFGEQLDLPANNWYLAENQIAPVISETNNDSHVKLIFKEREITGIASSSSSKTNETVVFKKRKVASNRQLRSSSHKNNRSQTSSNID